MQIGRKIYYNKTTGEVVWDKGEMSGSVRETTFEEDKAIMPEIDNLDVAVMTLEFGEKQEEFKASGGFLIDDKTKEITFLEPKQVVVVDIVQQLTEENIALKAEKEVLLQTIAAKDEIISEKESLLQTNELELQEVKSMAGMVPDPEAR